MAELFHIPSFSLMLCPFHDNPLPAEVPRKKCIKSFLYSPQLSFMTKNNDVGNPLDSLFFLEKYRCISSVRVIISHCLIFLSHLIIYCLGKKKQQMLLTHEVKHQIYSKTKTTD